MIEEYLINPNKIEKRKENHFTEIKETHKMFTNLQNYNQISPIKTKKSYIEPHKIHSFKNV